MNQVPMVNGERRINRHELGKYDKPLYKQATESRDVIVYYEGDDIPEQLLQPPQ